MAKVVVLAPIPPEAVAGMLPDGHEVVAPGPDEGAVEICRGAEVCVASWSASRGHRVDAAVVDALAGTCRLVQVPAAGVDSVDVAACEEAGIPVANCAGVNAVAVAEWCVWGAVGALRELGVAERALRAGDWQQIGRPRFELAGKVVGIVGMGDVGQACATRFSGFDVDVRYWTRTRRPEDVEERLGIAWSDLDDLVAAADVLVLAIALSDETEHLLDRDRIATMKSTAVVVNAARGRVVDEVALADALAEERLHGAATDVFSTEPPPADHPLVRSDRAILSPHVAGATAESAGRIFQRAIDNVVAVLDGREPASRVV